MSSRRRGITYNTGPMVGLAFSFMLHGVAIATVSIAFLGFRFGPDPTAIATQTANLWTSFIFWRYAVLATFIMPLIMTMILVLFPTTGIIRTFHFITILIYIVFALVIAGFMIFTLINCDDFSHCKNRFFPAESIPDHTFYMLFISMWIQMGVFFYYGWFNGFVSSTVASIGGTVAVMSSNIGSSYQKSKQNSEIHEHTRHMGRLMQSAIVDMIQSENPDWVPPEMSDDKLGRVMYHALLKKNVKKNGTIGTGIPSLGQFTGHSLFDHFGWKLNANTKALVRATKLVQNPNNNSRSNV